MKPVDLWISIFYFMAGGDHRVGFGRESTDYSNGEWTGSVRKSGRSGRRGVQRHPDGVCFRWAAEGGATVQGQPRVRQESGTETRSGYCSWCQFIQVSKYLWKAWFIFKCDTILNASTMEWLQQYLPKYQRSFQSMVIRRARSLEHQFCHE